MAGESNGTTEAIQLLLQQFQVLAERLNTQSAQIETQTAQTMETLKQNRLEMLERTTRLERQFDAHNESIKARATDTTRQTIPIVSTPHHFATSTAAEDESRRRTLVKAKGQQCPKYKGQKEAGILHAFLEDYEDYVQTAGFSDAEIIGMFPHYLEGKAKDWWRTYKAMDYERDTLGYIAKWTLVKESFKLYFLPKNHAAVTRAAIHDLDPKKLGIPKYIDELRSLLLLLPDHTDQEVRDLLYQKLDPNIYLYLRARGVVTSEDMFNELREWASIQKKDYDIDRRANRATRPRSYHGTHQRYSTQREVTPMEVDAAYTGPFEKLQKNKKMKDTAVVKNEHLTVTERNYNDFDVFPRLTDKLRAFLRAKNGCFFCRELNSEHDASHCPAKKARRKERAVNFH